MDPSLNLQKARQLREDGKNAVMLENYRWAIDIHFLDFFWFFREALRLFHQCILLTRAIDQTCSVSIHQNAIISDEAASGSTSDPNIDAQKLVDERARRIAIDEEAKNEAQELMVECYLNLANCVLNGRQRSIEDYRRAIQYCNNVSCFDIHR
jgi:hypothetical protein